METSDGGKKRLSVTNQWILDEHDQWTRVTVSPFYLELQKNSLKPEIFNRWLADQIIITSKLSIACERVQSKFASASPQLSILPCSEIVDQQYAWLLQQATQLNVEMYKNPPEKRLAYGAQHMIEQLEMATSPNASLVTGLTAIWTICFATAQGWRLCMKSSVLKSHQLYVNFGQYFTREEALLAFVETQDVLDSFLTDGFYSTDKQNRVDVTTMHAESAHSGKDHGDLVTLSPHQTFLAMLRCIHAHLQHIVYRNTAGDKVFLCDKCGRHGHEEDICTFKGHV